jgi:hypothetical protein
MGSLYAITVLEGALDKNHGAGQGAVRIQKMIEKDQLGSSTPRSFIEGKIKEQSDLTKKRKAKENEKRIEGLVKGQVIAKPSTLQDFIDKADLFRTIVVIPTLTDAQLTTILPDRYLPTARARAHSFRMKGSPSR